MFRSKSPIDWRGWIILVWALFFGARYGAMILEQRGGMLSRQFSRTDSRGDQSGITFRR
jgi:hypothetical protein